MNNKLVLLFFGTNKRYFCSITVLATLFLFVLVNYFGMGLWRVGFLLFLALAVFCVTELMRGSPEE
ncbi:MAG: hypothetical protein WCS97_02285 [Candidatus Paceibacterota bacterium]|jgi:hypothetical protein